MSIADPEKQIPRARQQGLYPQLNEGHWYHLIKSAKGYIVKLRKNEKII